VAVKLTRSPLTLSFAVGVLALTPLAPSGDRQAASQETFQGTCQFSGKLRQKPPVTNEPAAGRAVATARGHCGGMRAKYFARARGTISCGGGSATGRGYIRLPDGRIHFRFSEVRGPGVAAIRLEGSGGGSAAGEARASEKEDPAEILEKCGGQGLRQVRIHIDLATTPSISG
jgi:hypothetical protein